MEKYSKAVRGMYPQFKKKGAHPMEKYIGGLAYSCGGKPEVAGYMGNGRNFTLIVGASKPDGWHREPSDPQDAVSKKCGKYWYVSVDGLIG